MATATTESAAPSSATASTAIAAPNQTVDRNGMSATSGPLDDSMLKQYEPGKGSVDDADGRKFLAKERDLENDMPVEEGAKPGSEAIKAGETAKA